MTRKFRLCAVCGVRTGYFYVLHPITDEPQWVCDACEKSYVRQRRWRYIGGDEYKVVKAQFAQQVA